MKKLLALLALLAMVVVGCAKGDNDVPNIFFALDKETVSIAPDGGSVDIVVYSNYKWEISGANDWCTPSVKNGSANEDGQKVTFTADVTYENREAIFWFHCADEKIKLVVSQLKGAIIPDKINTFYIPARGAVAAISYQTSVECDIIIPEEAQSWISIAPATRGLVRENINLDIAMNKTGDQRQAIIKVVSVENSELFAEYNIIQKNLEYYIEYTSTDNQIVEPYDDSAFGVTILSNTYKNGVGIIEFSSPITKIGASAFDECSNLTSVTIPDSVTSIGDLAFYDCTNLKIATIGNSVTSIGSSAFSKCSNLTSVTIPNSVNSIGIAAFSKCSSLTSVSLPNSVTSIGTSAFSECSSLTSVSLPNSITSIPYGAFRICTSLKNVTIPDNVTKIENMAFRNCTSLTSLTFGNRVTSIGIEAFYNCESLISVTIGNSVTVIGSRAFSECRSMTSVTIPKSVIMIESAAFSECPSLTSVYCKATTPPNTGNNNYIFYNNASTRKIYVPTESVDAYKSANGWNEYEANIVGYDF